MANRGDLASVDDDMANDWWLAAECVHHADEVNFFPERGESGRQAKAICAVCPVRPQCLEFGLRTGSSGVWGGLTDRERRELRRAQPR